MTLAPFARLNTLTPSRRYAETQTATNGIRYRDWICTFASSTALEKCKLEAHVLDITSYHQALVPWKRDPSTVEWVAARSSLPLEQRVLRDNSSSATSVPRFTAFVRASKARLLQDLKSLPMRDGQTITDRLNVSVYPDETTQQVLVVYSPTGSQQLEFISFTLLDPVK